MTEQGWRLWWVGFKALSLRITGRVQRVGFRRYVLDLAQELGLTGSIKNMPDGSVAVFVQGEETALNDFLVKLREPRPPASIKDISVEEVEPEPDVEFFTIEYGPLEEELQEGFGAMQTVFMEYWREFRDYRGEFREFREEFREFREEFREFAKRTDENFKALFKQHEEMSEKLTIILEMLARESKETREMLAKALNMLADAIKSLKTGNPKEPDG